MRTALVVAVIALAAHAGSLRRELADERASALHLIEEIELLKSHDHSKEEERETH